MIAVTDTGVGMDATTLERAFEPFFTTKEVGKGTGLGLSQVYGFVRQSAGHVQIYSELGEGTTVKIYLPRHTRREDDRRRKSSAVERRSRAIGAETHPGGRGRRCAARLHRRDPERSRLSACWRRANGAAALEILDAEPTIDLLFTDVVMPGGMNGRQLADEAVRRRPGLKVLFTTGYTRNAIVHHGRLDPGVQMIGKPFSFDDWARRFARCWTADAAWSYRYKWL